MGHSREDVLNGLQRQLQDIAEALGPIEQQLSFHALDAGARQALQRRRGRLLHRQQLLNELIAGLQPPNHPAQ